MSRAVSAVPILPGVSGTRPDAWPGVWRGLGSRRTESAPTGFALLDDALLGGWPIGALSQLVTSAPGLGFSLMVPLLARYTAGGRHAALVSPPFIPYAPALCNAGVALDKLIWVKPGEAAIAPSLARGPRLDPIGEGATGASMHRAPRLDPIGEGATGASMHRAPRLDPIGEARDALWAAEQMLRSGLFAAVALWSPALSPVIERRLQLAAETGRSVAWIAHPSPCPAKPQPRHPWRAALENVSLTSRLIRLPSAHTVSAVRLEVGTEPDGLRVVVQRCRGGYAGARVLVPFVSQAA